MPVNRLLIVATNTGEYRKVGYRTGLWLSELTHFWDAAEEAGFAMDIASPTGGHVPIDPESLMIQELGHSLGIDGKVHRRYADRVFMDRLATTLRVEDVDHARYDAIYLTGGHGVMFDFPTSLDLTSLVTRFYEAGKIVSAVCHGAAGLLEARLGDGHHLIRGKALTAFSWREEILARRADAVSYNLEDQLVKRGAKFKKSAIPFARHVVVDGRLITGQNPASAHAVALAVIDQLRDLTRAPVRDILQQRRAPVPA